MTRHLAPPLIRAALNLGTYLEQFLGGFVVNGLPAIRWIMLQKGADDDDFDDDEDEFEEDDAGEDEDDGDEDAFILKYFEVYDEGDEQWADVYDFSPVSGDPDDDEPAARHRLATLEEALALAVERYGADPARFVNQTMIGHEYYDYVMRGRR
jgi:hypothetical protein